VVHHESIHLRVNGRDFDIEVEASKLLSATLREDCRAMSGFSDCERGACGACTVLVDGHPVRACLTFAIQVQGSEITTIEASDRGVPLSPLQRVLQQEIERMSGVPEMQPVEFNYHRPASLDEALDLLALHGERAKALAGGQSLTPVMRQHSVQPSELVDLNELRGLDQIDAVGDTIVVGALLRHQQLLDSELLRQHCPMLIEAAQGIDVSAVRQRGTLGGSLAHADPAACLPLAAVTLNAQIEIASQRGRRELPAADFFVAARTSALAPDELVVAVRFPALALHEGTAFCLFKRGRGEFAIASAAARVRLHGERIKQLRLGVGGVEAVPVHLDELAARQSGCLANAEWVDQVATEAAASIKAADDERASETYRRELVKLLVTRALRTALARAGLPLDGSGEPG
jgi:carbon-monoxide dehydrogenase medium subunit